MYFQLLSILAVLNNNNNISKHYVNLQPISVVDYGKFITILVLDHLA